MGVDDVKCYDCEYLEKATCHHPANPRPVAINSQEDLPCRRDMQAWDEEDIMTDDRYRPWTPEENQYLLDRQGWSHEVLARRLRRTAEGVECRLMWLQERSA